MLDSSLDWSFSLRHTTRNDQLPPMATTTGCCGASGVRIGKQTAQLVWRNYVALLDPAGGCQFHENCTWLPDGSQ